MVLEKYSTTAIFAISEGWNWKAVPGMPSQRRALLRMMPILGIATKNNRITDSAIIGFASLRNHW